MGRSTVKRPRSKDGERHPDTGLTNADYAGVMVRAAVSPAENLTAVRLREIAKSAEGWRKRIQAAKIKFDDGQKQIYLTHLAATGLKGRSARAAGVCPQLVADHIKIDPDFEKAVFDAFDEYRDKLLVKANQLAFEGIDEPIIGGRFKDEIVGHKKVFATNILAMELRRIEPGFRDKSELDLNVKGGALVCPPGMTPEQWAATFAKAALPAPVGE